MKRIFVLEGLDRCGKSTHARLLADWYKNKGKHPINVSYARPIFDDYDYSYSFYLQDAYTISSLLNDPNVVIIMDRSFLGEYVWGRYRSYNGEKLFKRLINRRIYQELIPQMIFFLFYDEYYLYHQRDDGKSMFRNEEEYDFCVAKFENAFKEIEKMAYHHGLSYAQEFIYLPDFKTGEGVEKDISMIQKAIRKKINHGTRTT